MPNRKPIRRQKLKASRKKSGRRLAILSRKETLYSTKRLVEAGRSRGYEMLVLDTLRCDLVVETSKPMVFYGGAELRSVEAVIPRIGASITRYGLAVVDQFSMIGVGVINDARGIARSRDKLRCLQLLAGLGIAIPRTVMMRDRGGLDVALRRVGGLPAIVKLIQGTQGVGVMIAHTRDELDSILDTMWNLDQEILLQEFISESKGRDIRALVVGDRVVAAMRRVAKTKGEFRSNIHRGGKGEAIDLPKAYADCAVRAAQIVGLDVAGVDMLESNTGPKIVEVNSSPGFEGLETATGIDVAQEIVSYAAQVVGGPNQCAW